MEIKTEINGQMHVASQYQIPYELLEKFINNIDPKAMKGMSALDLMRKSFEFGYMLVALDEEDMKSRIANLTEQNLKWFGKADALEAELIKCREQLERLKNSAPMEETLKNPPISESSSHGLLPDSPELESELKKLSQSEDSPISTGATEESTLS